MIISAAAHHLGPASSRQHPRRVHGEPIRRPPRSLWSNAWKQFRRHHIAVAGVVTLLALGVATTLGPLVYQVPSNAIDFSAALRAPSLAHPLGTDDLGRDLLARLCWQGDYRWRWA